MTRCINIEPGDLVSPATDDDAIRIGSTFKQEITKDSVFRVCVVVAEGYMWLARWAHLNDGCEFGLIIALEKNGERSYSFPYIWSPRRFTKIGKGS